MGTNALLMKKIAGFNLRHTLACGQCFHYYEEEDGSYTIVSGNRFVNVKQEGEIFTFEGIDEQAYMGYWHHYFDLTRDYRRLESELRKIDDYLNRAIDYGSGMHVLNQDPYDMVMMFIISANNNIKRITNTVKTMSAESGEYLGECKGRKLYGFPKAKILQSLSLDTLRGFGLGYRDKYIKSTAAMLDCGEVNLESIRGRSLIEVENELMKLSGVGKKVADCIALFAYERTDAFPLDTWVKKIMMRYYGVDHSNKKELEKFVESYFGDYAGFAQQYLFYHIRVEG